MQLKGRGERRREQGKNKGDIQGAGAGDGGGINNQNRSPPLFFLGDPCEKKKCPQSPQEYWPTPVVLATFLKMINRKS